MLHGHAMVQLSIPTSVPVFRTHWCFNPSSAVTAAPGKTRQCLRELPWDEQSPGSAEGGKPPKSSPFLSSSVAFTHFPSSCLGWGSRDHKPPNEPRNCGILEAVEHHRDYRGTKCSDIPPKKLGDGCSSLPSASHRHPWSSSQQSTSRWEMPFLEEIPPRASHGKEEREEEGWECFPLR